MSILADIKAKAAAAAKISIAFAAAKFCLELVALTPYGYFRDELYYLACANHLDWGYVDHPPLSIALLAAWRAVFGDSIAAIRIVPALAGALLVLATGLVAAELGGGALAAGIACFSVFCAPALAGVDHIYSMNAIDHAFWCASALLLLRTLDAPSTKRWVALGVVLGLGLENKIDVLWLGAGIAASLVALAELRPLLKTRGPFLCAGIALALFLPYAAWEVSHGYPTLEFMRNATADKYVRHSPLDLLRESAMAMNPMTFLLAAAGVVAAFMSPAGKRAKPLAIIFVATLAIVMATKGAKAEYLDAAYSLAVPSGAVALERAITGKNGSIVKFAAGAWAIASLVLFAIALPFALPVLSETSFIAYAKRLGVTPHSSEKKELGELPQFYADMHGWDDLVRETKSAFDALPPEERSRARIFATTGGYGPAAAIDVLGRRVGLPGAISGHNNYWLWGYGSDDEGPVILLGGDEQRLRLAFDDLTRVGTVECGYCMPYENHKPIYVGRKMRMPWRELWPKTRHYE